MQKKLILVIFLFTLTSCRMVGDSGMAMYAGVKFKIPPGTPAFRKGYEDGCKTAIYTRGNILYRTFYKYQFDPKMIGNPEYRLGHSRAYGYCFPTVGSAVTGPQSSFDRFINPYGYDSTFSAGNINNTWGGAFSGTMGDSITGNGFNGIFDVLQKGGSGTGETALGGNPLWAGGSRGQFLGW
ncbi:MAG: hypothetical protein RL769_621 [Pseudomonadota bacterium]